MSGSGGFAVSRTPSGDRFYNSPAMRRHQHLLLQQQQQVEQRRHQQQKQLRSEPAAEAEARTDSDDSTLSKPSVCSASPPRPAANMTNIDRLVESVTPVVPAQYTSEVENWGFWFWNLFACLPLIRISICLVASWENWEKEKEEKFFMLRFVLLVLLVKERNFRQK